ncbi:MAG: response regulator [Rhodoferax sp.]
MNEPSSAIPKLLFAVDDDIDVGSFIAHASNLVHFEAHGIASGRELLLRLVEKPDVIVLDVAMPDLDGIEVISALADAQFEGCLVIASGFNSGVVDMAAMLAKARGLRLTGVLTKPFDMEKLHQMLAQCQTADKP